MASTRSVSPVLAQPGSSNHGIRGGGRRAAAPGSPSQIQTNGDCSWTGNVRTQAPRRDVLLRGDLDAAAVGVVGEPVIAADDAIALEPAGRKRIRAVDATVLHRHDLTRAAAVEHDRDAEQPAPEQCLRRPRRWWRRRTSSCNG